MVDSWCGPFLTMDAVHTANTPCKRFSLLISEPVDAHRLDFEHIHLLACLPKYSQPLHLPEHTQHTLRTRSQFHISSTSAHPPVKVVKPDWGNLTSNPASSNPSLKATWLGHEVRHSSPLLASRHYNTLFFFLLPRASLSSFRVLLLVQSASHLASCSTPIFSECAGPSSWLGVDVACLLLAL